MLSDNFQCYSESKYTQIVEDLIEVDAGYASGPERALMSALLFDGVQSYFSYCFARGAANKAKYQEAYYWVTRQNQEYVFSFENVCESLGIDADHLRLGLVNVINSQKNMWKRARRHN